MRTTIEISDEQRAKLLETAAKRGEKGFSSIVEKALEEYFEAELTRSETVQEALAAIGSLGKEETKNLRDDISKLRGSWR